MEGLYRLKKIWYGDELLEASAPLDNFRGTLWPVVMNLRRLNKEPAVYLDWSDNNQAVVQTHHNSYHDTANG